jgi:hypothetical protein
MMSREEQYAYLNGGRHLHGQEAQIIRVVKLRDPMTRIFAERVSNEGSVSIGHTTGLGVEVKSLS